MATATILSTALDTGVALEGEILSTDLFGQDFQVGNEGLQERTPPGTVQLLTPGKVSTPQPGSQVEAPPKPESDTQSGDSVTTKEPETAPSSELNGVAKVEVQETEQDHLSDFLPSLPTIKCSEELQVQ